MPTEVIESLLKITHDPDGAATVLLDYGDDVTELPSLDGEQVVEVADLVRSAGVQTFARGNDSHVFRIAAAREAQTVRGSHDQLFAGALLVPRGTADVLFEVASGGKWRLKNASIRAWPARVDHHFTEREIEIIGGELIEVVMPPTDSYTAPTGSSPETYILPGEQEGSGGGEGGGGLTGALFVKYVAQTLDETQKAQARENIGALAVGGGVSGAVDLDEDTIVDSGHYGKLLELKDHTLMVGGALPAGRFVAVGPGTIQSDYRSMDLGWGDVAHVEVFDRWGFNVDFFATSNNALLETEAVRTVGDQTIAGAKVFTAPVEVGAATQDDHAVRLGQLDSAGTYRLVAGAFTQRNGAFRIKFLIPAALVNNQQSETFEIVTCGRRDGNNNNRLSSRIKCVFMWDYSTAAKIRFLDCYAEVDGWYYRWVENARATGGELHIGYTGAGSRVNSYFAVYAIGKPLFRTSERVTTIIETEDFADALDGTQPANIPVTLFS